MKALPDGYDARKELKLYDFMFGYFPLAWLEVVRVAVAGNNQHNPGEPMHWARGKSVDQLNTAFRHLFDHGCGEIKDGDGCYHLAKSVWRLMAELQLILEKEHDARGENKKQDRRGAEGRRRVVRQASAERARRTAPRLPRRTSRVRVRHRGKAPRR